jgi:hypothetical protein
MRQLYACSATRPAERIRWVLPTTSASAPSTPARRPSMAGADLEKRKPTKTVPAKPGAAHRALAACDRLVFFGYSMPSFDIEAEKEFQRAIARNRKLAHVDVVNPATASATRYAEAFPRRSVHWHSNLEHFLDRQPFG